MTPNTTSSISPAASATSEIPGKAPLAQFSAHRSGLEELTTRSNRVLSLLAFLTLAACAPDVIVQAPEKEASTTNGNEPPKETRSSTDDADDAPEEIGPTPSAPATPTDPVAMTYMAVCPVDGKLGQEWSAATHDGIDLSNTRGTPIFAVGGGVVIDSGLAQGYGQWIRIKHDDGSVTVYGHMYQREVAVGAKVTPGQRIALMGADGEASEPKLHLGTYKSAASLDAGAGMNPVDYLKERGLTLPCKPGGGAGQSPLPGTVTTWKEGDVRSCARTSCSLVAHVGANTVYTAKCYAKGQAVQTGGYVNDKWVKINLPNGAEGYIPAILLVGDDTAGVKEVCPSEVNPF